MKSRISISLVAAEYVPAAAPVDAQTFRAADFRLHPAVNLLKPHWLLSHPYGRDVLVNKAREVRPDLHIPRYRRASEVDGVLDAMIDLMGMRDWPAPQTLAERVRVGFMLLRIGFAQGSGQPVPEWRAMYNEAPHAAARS